MAYQDRQGQASLGMTQPAQHSGRQPPDLLPMPVPAQAKDEGGNVADKISHEAHKAADATKKQVDKLGGPVEKVHPLLGGSLVPLPALDAGWVGGWLTTSSLCLCWCSGPFCQGFRLQTLNPSLVSSLQQGCAGQAPCLKLGRQPRGSWHKDWVWVWVYSKASRTGLRFGGRQDVRWLAVVSSAVCFHAAQGAALFPRACLLPPFCCSCHARHSEGFGVGR